VDLGSLQDIVATGGTQLISVQYGNCDDCHNSAYFDSHVHGIDGGYVDHLVSHQAGVDVGQGGAECNTCHNNSDADGINGRFSSWTDILGKHGDCDACHSYVDNGTPPEADNTAALTGGAAVTCVDCHTPKEENAADPSHGGHNAADFGWTSTGNNTQATCGGGGVIGACHDYTVNTDVVATVHNGNFAGVLGTTCQNCHETSSGGAQTTILGPTDGDGDARLASGPPLGPGKNLAADCFVCHNGSIGAIHHDHADVAAGNCDTCHSDPRPTPSGMLHAPYQMSCRACHIDVAGNTVTVMGITEGVAGSTANGLQSGNSRTPVVNHSWTITAASIDGSGGLDKIRNYGACLYCHGSTGRAAGRATLYHVPYGPQKTWAQMGGTSMVNPDAPLFRSGAGYGGTPPLGEQAFFGHGRGRFNMKRAEFSIKDHYLQPGDFGENLAAHTEDYVANAAMIPNMYNYFEMYSANLGANAVVPVFDTDYLAGSQCSASCDTLTIDTATCSKGGSCLDTRVLTIVASSTDNTAQLTVIHGGVATPMSCSSGNCNVTIDYSGYPAETRFDPTSPTLDSVWVISDKGGSVRWEAINNR